MIGRFASLVIGNWQIALGVVALLIGTHGLAYCQGRSDGRANLIAEQSAQRAEEQRRDAQSKGEAAQERATDNEATSANQKGRDDAIKQSEGGDTAPSNSRNALNCERLRAAGADLNDFPACRGREGRNEAPANR